MPIQFSELCESALVHDPYYGKDFVLRLLFAWSARNAAACCRDVHLDETPSWQRYRDTCCPTSSSAMEDANGGKEAFVVKLERFVFSLFSQFRHVGQVLFEAISELFHILFPLLFRLKAVKVCQWFHFFLFP